MKRRYLQGLSFALALAMMTPSLSYGAVIIPLDRDNAKTTTVVADPAAGKEEAGKQVEMGPGFVTADNPEGYGPGYVPEQKEEEKAPEAQILSYYTPRYVQMGVPEVAANGAAIYDVDRNRFLFGKNDDVRYFPASITKLMTALIVVEHAKLDETVVFSRNAVTNLESGAVTLGLTTGDRVSVQDCLYGLLLKSANEVANGLAEHVAGSVPAFAAMMNEKAVSLGCTNTNFVNPNGLNNPAHQTTAHDMALIGAAALKNPTIRQICGTLSYQFPATKNANYKKTITPGHKMVHPDDSRFYPGVIGGKTGYTSLAGNTLVTGCEKETGKLVTVILDSRRTQYQDTKILLDYGYEFLDAENRMGRDSLPQGGLGHWYQENGIWFFEKGDGTLLKGVTAVIDGVTYSFDAEGHML